MLKKQKKNLRSVGKKDRIMGERMTGKDQFKSKNQRTGPEVFFMGEGDSFLEFFYHNVSPRAHAKIL
jgi:hypothetical protein